MIVLSNNATSNLAADIIDTDFSLTVLSGDGAKFPTFSGVNSYFYITLSELNKIEIVRVNSSNGGDIFAIVRAQDGTIAQSFTTAARVEQRWNKKQIFDHISDFTTSQVVNISNNASVISIVFADQRPTNSYAVKFCFECPDANPIFLSGIIQNKLASGFDILMNAPTDSANYKLNFSVGEAR